MQVQIKAVSSKHCIEDTKVVGELIKSNDTLLKILGNDGYYYTVKESSNEKDNLLVMHNGSEKQVKGVVEEIEIEVEG